MATSSGPDDCTENTIRLLPTTTRTKLRSSQILTSLSQIISELLQNSLDAHALQVEVGVDCEEWSCWVRDDGVGINKQDMSLLGKGSEDGRYGTSKAYSPDSLDVISTFGFRGEALASAAELSCLEISSRTSKSRESWSIILKGGRTLYNGPSVRWRRETPGTVVCIRDAFYNLPIRRLSHPSPTSTMNIIRQEIETYALVFPKVSFSLENTNHAPNKGHVIKVPKTTSTLAAFRHLYGRALAEHVDEINETLDEMKLDGFISLHGAHSKGYQFLYINRHPLATCDLHRIIDDRFNSSSFMKNAYDETGETGLPRSTVRRSPRKMERKHVYVLNITLPPHHIDNCLEPAKASVHLRNKDVVSLFLSSVVQSFLIRHGFITQELLDRRQTKGDESPSPSPSKRRKHSSMIDTAPMIQPTFLSISTTVDEKDRTRVEEVPIYAYHGDDTISDDELVWKNPATGEYFTVDKRTGNSRTLSPTDYGKHGEFDGGLPTSSRRTLPRIHNGEKAGVPEWIQEALRENQAYALTEPKIPALSISSQFAPDAPAKLSSFGLHSCGGHGQDTQSVARYFQMRLNAPETGESLRLFHRQDLCNAQIINQVDRKFIACLMDDYSDDPERLVHGRSLVLIDQHAADERVRVERFLKGICQGFLHWEDGVGGVRTRKISPPVSVLLTRHEALRLGSSNVIQLAFEAWGFRFAELRQGSRCEEDEGVDVGNEYVQVLVQSIPEIVSDKLLVGDELRELIKGFLGQLETDTLPFPSESALHSIREDARSTNTEFGWLKALRWCPRQLLDLINSKACRGAIMFNDSLSLDQCEQLVRQLSETAFPFQCAHGRPSLVPLVNIKAGMGNNDGRRCRPNVRWTEFRHQSDFTEPEV